MTTLSIGGDSLMQNDLFQKVDGGANPTSPLQLVFRKIRPTNANNIFVKNHYARRAVPISISFGAFLGVGFQNIVGAMSFGKPASPSLCSGACGKENAHRIYELNRLWMSDIAPRNSESRFIGWALRILKEIYPEWIIVSYADTAQGHTGSIYRATGWIYTGLSDARECGDYATNDNKHSRHGIKSEIPNVPRSRKNRYFYFLKKEDQKLLKYPAMKYKALEAGDNLGG